MTGNFVLALAYTGPYQLIHQTPGSIKLLDGNSQNPEEMNLPYFGIYGDRNTVMKELTDRINVFFDALEKENLSS